MHALIGNVAFRCMQKAQVLFPVGAGGVEVEEQADAVSCNFLENLVEGKVAWSGNPRNCWQAWRVQNSSLRSKTLMSCI